MKKPVLFVIISCFCSLIVLVSCKTSESLKYEINERIRLDSNWTFCMKGDSSLMPATIPGCVHTDLLTNGKIPEPFYRNNEKQLQWIDKEDWIYRCVLTLDSNQLSHNLVNLNFKGLDTYTKVLLNGRRILTTDNMFRCWTKEVKQYLREGNNTLEVEFISPVKRGLEKLAELGYGLPSANDQSEVGGLGDKKISVFTRKAPYHFGWDWGPRFVTSGVWRPVELEFIDYAKIEDVYFQQSLVNAYEATIDAVMEIDVWAGGEYTLAIHSGTDPDPLVVRKIGLEQGINSITLPFTINKPELWWPNGMGEQKLYNFRASLMLDNVVLDTLGHRIGLRSLELVRKPDSLGASFYFAVNGVPVFVKGANYIPNDNFLNRVTPEKYEYIVRSAAEAHMNMLRVWGGGIYENDLFYELCDRYGLLIWQDFMFACSMYPGDDAFLKNVRNEAIDNVKRIRNHASIALWCGNNEIDAAWCEGDMSCGWGWKQHYNQSQREAIWHSYDTLFYHMLPDIISLYDPTRAYWPSSPLADWGEHSSYSSAKGDIHYWGVWHGNEPFDAFYRNIGRFMSEYGFQSLPGFQSIGKFTLPEDWDLESTVLLSHQRSGYGNSRIVDYMKKLYPVPDDFRELLYVGQVMQAEAIKSAILAHRAAKPYCMGTMYWQINDCWPAASWSSIDYYGSWKALHYLAGKAYEPVTISFFPDGRELRVFLNNDLLTSDKMTFQYTIRNFKGETLTGSEGNAVSDPYGAVEIFDIDTDSIKNAFDTREIYLLFDVNSKNKISARDIYFFGDPKDLALPVVDASVSTKQTGDKLNITLGSDQLVKNVCLWIDGFEGHFSDNYFDLLPGEEITVSIDIPGDKKIADQDIHMLTMNTILNKYKEDK